MWVSRAAIPAAVDASRPMRRVRLRQNGDKNPSADEVDLEQGEPAPGYLREKDAQAQLQALLTDARRGASEQRRTGDGLPIEIHFTLMPSAMPRWAAAETPGRPASGRRTRR